ncbi:centrosomal protein of 152 kDa [Polymixia lowei]
MSIDFDSAALQTQQDDEEYDQEDYAREQELHKLLTNLPDDMLEDSRDSSSSELEYSACSNRNTVNGPTSNEENYEDDYNRGSDHDEYVYEDGAVHINGHSSHPQRQPLPQTWSQQSQSCQFNQGGYTHTNTGTEQSTETNDFSINDFSTEGYEPEPYPHVTNNPVEYDGEGGRRDKPTNGDQNNTKKHFQDFDYPGSGDRRMAHYKASYNPHKPACQPKMFNSQAPHHEGDLDHLQREFLDTAQNTADDQQLAQLQILNKAQQRQIEDLERKLEDSKRNMRYLEHQFAIVKDEKDGLGVSLQESSRLLEEAKEREVQMQNKVKSLEQQVQALTERDHENMKKQRMADAAVDSMKQQMVELCRSDTLSRAREQHDRDLSVMREQHEAELLALHQKLDSSSQTLKEQTEVGERLREQVKQLERQREDEQVERAGVINALTQRLEESQQQCAKLLQTGSVQEMSQMQIKLQQARSAKALSENMNKVLQEDLADLKEQITLYESAVKHGVVALELTGDWEKQLSESYVDLGIKKANWKNGRLHCNVLTDLSDPKLPKEETLRELRAELQRCLASLKGKRQKISQLQEELQLCQARGGELQTQLDEAQLRSTVRDASQAGHLDMTGAPQKQLMKLQEDKQVLQDQVQALENKNKELRQSEEKVRAANLELCTKMREMIQELDQEKQEAAERYEQVQQQYRDDVVNHVRTELALEHKAQVDQLTTQYQQQSQQLQTQLSEANDKMIAVQECYISVCKEKDMLEESLRSREQEDALTRENELKLKEESSAALEKLRTELEAQHQTSVNQLNALWSKEKEAEIQKQVNSQIASAKAAWKEKQEKMERTWAQRLEEAGRTKHTETAEESSQTDEGEAGSLTITVEELDSRLSAQKQRLQLEADKAKRRAVEEARKQAQRELQEKHLDDLAKQVEGALTRAYSCWLEDLTSLPEYKANLQREKDRWEELQENFIQQQVSQALRVAEEHWQEKHRGQLEQHGAGAQRVEELQEEVACLQIQLERFREEQAALLKAELAGARAAWSRDKRQEISSIQVRSEQQYHAKLQEQHRKAEQVLQQAKEEFELQKKGLLLQMEAELPQALKAREEEWRGQLAEKEQAQRQRAREDFIAELQTGLAELQAQLLRDTNTEQQNSEETRRVSRTTPEGTITYIVQSSCKDMLTKAVLQAKKEWKKISEERLTCVTKERQEQHEREIGKIQSSLLQTEGVRCGKQCTEVVGKLQKKNQDLQRHLEKACRHLQHTVRDNKASMQRLKCEHECSLRKAKEDHLLQLEEVKKSKESSGRSDHQQNVQLGLEEMKQQYTIAVEKIRGDMLRYLQESKERAAEMIRVEVQRERQDTARKMRRYYLTCLQDLLEDGGQTTGAEKKIMSAAGKLVAMAKVLETPVKRKSGKNHSLPGLSTALSATGNTPSRKAGFSKNPPTLSQVPEIRPEERTQGEKTYIDSAPQIPAAARSKPSSKAALQDIPMSGKEETSEEAVLKAQAGAPAHHFSYKPSRQTVPTSQVNISNMSLRSKSREAYLQGVDSGKADDFLDSDPQSKRFLIQEPPVRDEGQSDWSAVSNGSNAASQVPALSYSGSRVAPVTPFPLRAASPVDLGEFGSLAPDISDVTVYNELAKVPPYTKTLNFPSAKMSTRREPIPGSEGDRQNRVCSKTLFSQIRQCQQDSGFDSPFSQQK